MKTKNRFFCALMASFIFIAFSYISMISLVEAKTENIEKAEKSEVIILTASWCHYCTKARQFLKNNHIKFTEYDIENSNLGYQLYRSLGGRGVPVVKIGQNVLFGYDIYKLKDLLNEGGYYLP